MRERVVGERRTARVCILSSVLARCTAPRSSYESRERERRVGRWFVSASVLGYRFRVASAGGETRCMTDVTTSDANIDRAPEVKPLAHGNMIDDRD